MTPPLNGHHPAEAPPALRMIWFGQSVISDWNNPVATTVRATMRALQQAGHTATFLEPRNSEPLVSALAERGSAIYRDFQSFFPDLHYRTYDMPRRAERDVWLSREAALVDAVVVQSDAPAEVFEWLGRVPDSPMVNVLIALEETAQSLDLFDLVLSPAAVGIGERFEPAVLRPEHPLGATRAGVIIAVYSDIDPKALARLDGNGAAETVAVGADAPTTLPFVSEAALSQRYTEAAQAIVVDADSSAFARARSMLPIAAGAETLRVDANGTSFPVEAFTDAREQSARLVRMIRDAQLRKRAGRVPGSSSES